MTQGMSNSAMFALIIGFLLPLLVAVFQQPRWSDPIRAAVALLVSLLAGAGTAYFAGDLGLRPETLVTDTLIIFVAAIAAYRGWWKPTGIAPAIEKVTSRAP